MTRLFDLREGEGRSALLGFAVVLLLIITGHTMLEAARDALLLAGPGPRALGIVYMAIATCAWPAAAVAGQANDRLGARRSLWAVLAAAAALPVGIFLLPTTTASAMVVYVISGLIGSIVVPQFWTLAGQILTAAQGRRLFGLIAAAGVLGGVLGSGCAAAALLVLPVKALLLLSAACFVLASVALLRVGNERQPLTAGLHPPVATGRTSALALARQPLLARIALGVVVSTATLLVLDYCFKASVTQSMPRAQIGPFVARYYLLLNGLSLAVQVLLGSAVVRRLGVTAAVLLTPLLLFFGAAGAYVAGGTLGAILVLKAIDGGLRFSIHRITEELVYLPVPLALRQHFKPFIDGALARAAQTATGAALLALGGTWLLAPRALAVGVTVLAGAWLLIAATMRKPYLALLRSSISAGSLPAPEGPEPLDLESAQLLVQHLASEDPLEVVAAMNALCRRGKDGFVPALVLLHPDERVLTAALEHFGASPRTDWTPLAHRMLVDRRESVRVGAARALARHGALDPAEISGDAGSRLRGYVSVVRALKSGVGDVLEDEGVSGLLRPTEEEAGGARFGMLAAIEDAPPTPSLARLLLALGTLTDDSPEATDLVARAAEHQRDPRLIPALVDRLAAREGREAVRSALVSFGDAGLEAVWWALRDTTRPRRFRIHVPKTLGCFGTRTAAERLLQSVETEEDGQVRYKSIRALEALVSAKRISLPRARVERLAREALVRHFGLLAHRVALSGAAPGHTQASAAERLLLGLLDDKLGQSLDRSFRLLAITRPREDFRRVRMAALSKDPFVRANAGELLDALLRHHDEPTLRALLRLVTEDLPAEERAARAAALTGHTLPASRAESLAVLEGDHDPILAGLATACARAPASNLDRSASPSEVANA